jgi:hypothetical protein
MIIEQFENLTQLEQATLLIAMQVRNEMEHLHDGITDALMKQLNQTIRQSILDGLIVVMNKDGLSSKQKAALREHWLFLFRMLPDYWEVPSEAETLNRLTTIPKKKKARKKQ